MCLNYLRAIIRVRNLKRREARRRKIVSELCCNIHDPLTLLQMVQIIDDIISGKITKHI
jgi:hypothetical protein